MLEWLNNLALNLGDVLFGWLLRADRNLVLFAVALGTAAILVLVRLFTTNQDLLRRCARDRKRLKQLLREAKRRKDRPAAKRHRTTIAMVTLKRMKSEGLPLLAALPPILILATWCFQRLRYYPPRADEATRLTAYFPVSSVGRMMHIVPQDGLRAEHGWLKVAEPATYQDQPHGRAQWTLRADARGEPYEIEIRIGRDTVRRRLLVGQRTYEPQVTYYPQRRACAEVQMREFRLFGIVPGIEALLMPPWLVAYLIIAIAFFPVVKLVLRIY